MRVGSARTIAAAAEVNQALIFYHFGSMDGLLEAACQRATEARVATTTGWLCGRLSAQIQATVPMSTSDE